MYSQVVFLPSIMLSGIMFSAELLPNFLESMGKLFPATWGYTLLIQKNIDVSTFIPIVIILIISVFISVQLLKKIRSE
jgi:ABC-2 type transport system permease protein